MAITVRKVENETKCEPNTKTNPGDDRQLQHQVEAGDDRDQRRDGHPRHSKGPTAARITAAEKDHPGRYKYEREQRPDVRQIHHFSNIRKCSKNGDEYAEE